MIGFLLSPLGLRIAGGLAVLVLVLGIVWSHDAKIRAKERAKWEPQIASCRAGLTAATDANARLDKDYKAFIAKHNTQLDELRQETARRLKERDKALAALGIQRKADETEIARLRAEAAAGPQPTPEEACAKATDTLRALAVDLVRDARRREPD